MTLKDLKEYCLEKPGASVNFPFDEKTMTINVGKKMFFLTDISANDLRVNLKCNPFVAEDLRAEFIGIIPGYHMNKKHWNTVYVNNDVPKEKILELIDHSYTLVYNSLTKKEREHITLFHTSEEK